MQVAHPEIQRLIERALQEDLSLGDPTTQLLIPPDLRGAGEIIAKAHGVLAGVNVALEVFRQADSTLETQALIKDGTSLNPKDVIARVNGSAQGILQGERTALNFLQRLSGIATETSRYVAAVRGLKARVLDTRKTTPGLRTLEKYAIRVGGGHNHRYNLGDGILIKDNHIAALRSRGMALGQIVRQARQGASHTLKVEVEVTTVEEALEALEAGAEVILLDNMELESIRKVVSLVKGRVLIEASGGVTLDRVRAVAETGVDLISVGALTHSVKALDISLELSSQV